MEPRRWMRVRGLGGPAVVPELERPNAPHRKGHWRRICECRRGAGVAVWQVDRRCTPCYLAPRQPTPPINHPSTTTHQCATRHHRPPPPPPYVLGTAPRRSIILPMCLRCTRNEATTLSMALSEISPGSPSLFSARATTTTSASVGTTSENRSIVLRVSQPCAAQQGDRERHTQRETHTQRERDRERATERQGERPTEREREREQNRDTQRERGSCIR